MRPLVIFLLCAVPATALLAWLDRRDQGGAQLPVEGPTADTPPLLVGSDLADAHGLSPFAGAVRRLDGFELRVVEEGYFKLYLRIERLGRHDDKPRLEDVRAAVFDPPREGRPNLRLTLRAPYVRGDPRDLLHATGEAPRIVTLDGGVEAFDAAGRPLAEVERLTIDAHAKTVATDVPLVLRMPERSAEVRAAGLDADLELRKARLRGPVVASAPLGGGTVTLRAKAATVEEKEDGALVLVVFEGDAEIEAAAGRATCPRIEALLAREKGVLSFRRATLSGGVRLELAPDTAKGIETIEMPSLAFEGEQEISCEGPVRATWRGRLGALALGDRTVRIDAAKASFRLGLGEDGQRLLDEARFDAFRAEDIDGAGALAGRSLVYARDGNVLVLEGAVEARTPEGSLAADRLRVEAPEKDAYDVRVEGEKRIVYRTEGRLGPLGDPGQGELRVTAKGPLELRVRGEGISFVGRDDVVVTTDGGASLRCAAMRLALEKGVIVSFQADGGVLVSEPARGAEIRGDSLRHEADAVTVEGRPASIALKEGRSVRAPTITYRKDGTFVATGGVETETPLPSGGTWRLACRDVRGTLAADGTPAAVEAREAVQAEGPAGEVVSGDSLVYDGAKGVATLLGAPARLRRGEEISLVAPKGLTLRIEDGQVVEGSSLGPSTIDYRPAAPADGKAPTFQRWVADLRGPARFEGDRVIVAEGARIGGSEGEREALVADAKRVEILLDVSEKAITVKEIKGSRGVRVEGRGKEPVTVTADRLSYVAGTREVRVAGDAQVVAEGWPRDVRFRELLFALTKDGIDLLRASDIEVR